MSYSVAVDFTAFFLAAITLAVTPGPSILYVVAISLRFGTRAGVVSALGVNVGSYFLILAAAFGLYPILQTFPTIVELTEIVGGLYLLYLGIRMWPKDRIPKQDLLADSTANIKQMFTQGFVTTLLNPKDILFYILFIPAFIDVPKGGPQFITLFLALSITYALMGITTKILFAMFAGKARIFLFSEKRKYINYISAIILFALGILALSQGLQSLF